METSRLLAVDPSLVCSGWALFAVTSGKLLGVGKVRSLGTSFPMARRLEDLQLKITNLLDGLSLRANDVLVCEAQTTMRDPKAALKVEQVRGLFEVSARSLGAAVPGRINPRTVQFEVMGLHGRQLTRPVVTATAVEVVRRTFSAELTAIGFGDQLAVLQRHQDIVDALLIGRLALSRLQHARVASVPMAALFDNELSERQRRRWGGI